MLRGYKPKTKPALWRSVAGAQAVRGPVKPDALERARARRAEKTGATLAPGLKVRQTKPCKRGDRVKTAERAAYRAEARMFVAAAVDRGEVCTVVLGVKELREGRFYGHPTSAKLNEVHHKRGRLGPLLRDQRHWMAISKQGHRWVHAHPKEARARGWLCEAGLWNKPDRSAP